MTSSRRRILIPLCSASVLGAALVCTSCGRDQSPATQAAESTSNAAATRPSLWKSVDATSPVAVVAADKDAQLQEAMAEARATAEQARQKWLYSSPDDRQRWAVKWAAPIAGKTHEHAEHLWVAPVHWSPFRIEGVLASTPVHPLACGKTLGELVSFPIEELSDWIHYTAVDASRATPDDPHEGGFTVRILRQDYGSPR